MNRNVKSAIRWSLLLLAASTLPAFYIVAVKLWLPTMKARAAQASPYYVELAQKGECGEKGKMEQLTGQIYARRSDGSYAEIDKPADGSPIKLRHLFLSSGWHVAVSDLAGTTTTTKEDFARRLRDELDPATDCEQTFQPGKHDLRKVGEGKIKGFRAIKIQMSLGVQWRVPDLGCVEVAHDISMPGAGRNVLEPVVLSKGEPPAWVFHIPSTYVEMSPLQVVRRELRIMAVQKGLDPDGPEATAMFERLSSDAAYKRWKENYRKDRPKAKP